MLNLAKGIMLLAQATLLPSVGNPAPPTQASFMTEGPTTVGYDVFDAEGQLTYRVTFTPVPGSEFGRPPEERVWVARKVRFLPYAHRAVERTTSLECSGLPHVLERMAALEVGRFNIAGLTELPLAISPQTRDGYTYRFHGPGYDPVNAHTQLTVEGSAGHIGDLGQAADFQLKNCWHLDSNG